LFGRSSYGIVKGKKNHSNSVFLNYFQKSKSFGVEERQPVVVKVVDEYFKPARERRYGRLGPGVDLVE
jgi:hypothetical protein